MSPWFQILSPWLPNVLPMCLPCFPLVFQISPKCFPWLPKFEQHVARIDPLSCVEDSYPQSFFFHGFAVAQEEKKKGGWSTGAKVAAGTGAVVAVGGLAVAGAVLGEHIAEERWDDV